MKTGIISSTIVLAAVAFIFAPLNGAAADDNFQLKDGRVSLNFDWRVVGNKKSRLDPALKQKYKANLENELQRDIRLLAEKVREAAIVRAVIKQNEEHKTITLREIMVLDTKWKAASENDKLILGKTETVCGNSLKSFQQKNEAFAEIFVTDDKGLNVCQTGKTTDYYQADEAWWQNALLQAKGQPTHGKLEYDESSETFAISVYAPVFDKDQNVIGIGKGVVRRKFGS